MTVLSRRRATPADLGDVVEMARHFHAAANPPFAFSDAQAVKTARWLTNHPDGFLAVLSHGDAIVGAFAGKAAPHPFAEFSMAVEMMWWIEANFRGSRSGLGMLLDFEAWARGKGCTIASLSSLAGDEHADLYRRMGYAPFEVSHLKGFA